MSLFIGSTLGPELVAGLGYFQRHLLSVTASPPPLCRGSDPGWPREQWDMTKNECGLRARSASMRTVSPGDTGDGAHPLHEHEGRAHTGAGVLTGQPTALPVAWPGPGGQLKRDKFPGGHVQAYTSIACASICPPICLSTCPSVHPSTCLPLHLPTNMNTLRDSRSQPSSAQLSPVPSRAGSPAPFPNCEDHSSSCPSPSSHPSVCPVLCQVAPWGAGLSP